MPSKDAAVPAELYSLVHAFLTANDQAKSAKSLKKAVDAKIEDVKGPDLMAIYDTHLAETGMSDKKRKKKALPQLLSLVHTLLAGNDMAKAAKALRKGVEEEMEELEGEGLAQIYAKHAKSSSSKKRKADSSDSDSSDSSESEEEEAPKKKKKSDGKFETPDAKTPSKVDEAEDAATPASGGSKKGSKTNTPFQRIVAEEQTYAKVRGGHSEAERLLDNTFESKGGDGYGAKASAILEKVRGKDFRHEKTKKKRGTYKGGPIDMGSNSLKFVNSDSEDE